MYNTKEKNMSIFENASRMKYRYDTSVGKITTEDLWDLPLRSRGGKPSLDGVAMSLAKYISESKEVTSFVDDSAPNSSLLYAKNRLEVVKAVISYKKDAEEKAAKKEENTLMKERLLQALDKKGQDAIDNMSEEEIQKKLKELS